MSRPHIVVCGGGLAGIAAALEASARGAAVTLIERRPFLGGKAYSFVDSSGLRVDNGQHVFLGCCTAYRDLLRVLGVAHLTTLQPTLDVPVRDRDGRTGSLRAAPLPAPLHMLPSFATYPLLDRRQKAAALRALVALGAARPERHDDITFAQWLARHDQSPTAIANFWDLIVLPTCNERSDRVSAALALFVFQEGFFRTRGGAAVGWSRVGLTDLIDPAARRVLADRGARVLSGTGVVATDGSAVELSDGTALAADGVILALPQPRAQAVCPGAVTTADTGSSPIVNVHVRFDRPVMDIPFVAVVDSPAQWIFDRGALTGDSAHHGQVAVSISGARAEAAVPRDELVGATVAELRALFTPARDATALATACIKEPEATFDPGPGQAARRPGTRTPISRVALAGAWTATGWPATMEGAVRSGIAAARALT